MRTLRTIGIVSSAIALLLSASVAFAEETGAVAPAASTPAPAAAPAAQAERKKEARDMRKEAQSRVQNAREDAQKLLEVRREEAKTLIKNKREEMKTLLETKREETKVRVEAQNMKAEKRLMDIKDKAKQEAAQRLAKRLEELNSTWTDRFMETLSRHSDVLQKMQDRAVIVASEGKDVVATTAAIASAKTAVETARTAIIAQAAKSYVLDTSTVTTTSATTTAKGQSELMKNLKTSFQNVHKTLFKDLFALRDGAMTDSRKAVQAAFKTLGKITGVEEKNATSTSATSNQ